LSRVYIKNRYEKNPPNTMRVTRPSRWGNPFKLTDHTREESLRKYEFWLKTQIFNDFDFLKPLYNKNLACTCKPNERCHIDILLKHIKMRSCNFCKFFTGGGRSILNCIHHTFVRMHPTNHYCYAWELDSSRWMLEEYKKKKEVKK